MRAIVVGLEVLGHKRRDVAEADLLDTDYCQADLEAVAPALDGRVFFDQLADLKSGA